VTENLSTLELEVEGARAKLANDLAFLRSPQPYREFGADPMLAADGCNLVLVGRVLSFRFGRGR
jgi:hypothetical protein